MLAEFRGPLEQFGAWFYRCLHWETGAVGQALYLEAEATGIRATGIGCFFDDATHLAFGLAGDRFQVLYHFTMGGAVDDPRLQTSPPYAGTPPGTARKLARPVLLSVGYSNLPLVPRDGARVARGPRRSRATSTRAIASKVDREERPDVNSIYMAAVELLTGGGGWAMTVA